MKASCALPVSRAMGKVHFDAVTQTPEMERICATYLEGQELEVIHNPFYALYRQLLNTLLK